MHLNKSSRIKIFILHWIKWSCWRGSLKGKYLQRIFSTLGSSTQHYGGFQRPLTHCFISAAQKFTIVLWSYCSYHQHFLQAAVSAKHSDKSTVPTCRQKQSEQSWTLKKWIFPSGVSRKKRHTVSDCSDRCQVDRKWVEIMKRQRCQLKQV